MPQRPLDTQLANIIDKLADFVARNGKEFEQMTKIKQQNNSNFSFLDSNSEHYSYYQFRLAIARRDLIGEITIICERRNGTKYCFSGMPQQPQNNFQQQQQQTIWSSNGNSSQQQLNVNFTAQIESINTQQMKLREQIMQSENNLSAQHQVKNGKFSLNFLRQPKKNWIF